jgi:hypothetical protein
VNWWRRQLPALFTNKWNCSFPLSMSGI